MTCQVVALLKNVNYCTCMFLGNKLLNLSLMELVDILLRFVDLTVNLDFSVKGNIQMGLGYFD